jgi:hypothetical protein
MFLPEKAPGEIHEQPHREPLPYRRMSDAIRDGSLISTQCREHLFLNGSSCALGAAILGLGLTPNDGPFNAIWFCEKFNIPMSMVNDIMYRNDAEKWSREGIANWLEKKGY